MAAYGIGLDPIEIHDLKSKVKVTVTYNVSKNDGIITNIFLLNDCIDWDKLD